MKDLGKGNFGGCTFAIHKDTGEKVVKKVSFTEKFDEEQQEKYLDNEGKVLQLWQHKYVVKLIKSFKYKDDYYSAFSLLIIYYWITLVSN